MILLPIILVFAGYGFGSWGYVLVKGYNITLREWWTPLHPFTGPLDQNGTVPVGQIFPGKGQGGAATSGTPKQGSNPISQSPAAKQAQKHSPGPQGMK
jgi:hypothetical protein